MVRHITFSKRCWVSQITEFTVFLVWTVCAVWVDDEGFIVRISVITLTTLIVLFIFNCTNNVKVDIWLILPESVVLSTPLVPYMYLANALNCLCVVLFHLDSLGYNGKSFCICSIFLIIVYFYSRTNVLQLFKTHTILLYYDKQVQLFNCIFVQHFKISACHHRINKNSAEKHDVINYIKK